jgi:DNA end-binding protein Ku
VPAGNAAARRPYVLLLNAMRETGMAAIGRFVLAGKEKLGLIRAKGDALALETLFVSEDVYAQDEIEEAVAQSELKAAELELATQVIGSMAAEFDPGELTSEYRSQLRELLEAKLAGREVTAPEPVEETPVIDLMEALKRSVAEAKDKKAPAKPAPKKPRARARAKA